MKKLMLATIATLSFTTGMSQFAVAQDMPAPTAQPPGTEGLPTPGNVPPAPGSAHPPGHHGAPPPPPPPPGADPNAAQPTGAVPADPGMAPAPAGAPSDPAAPVGSPGNPVTVGGNVTPPPTEAKDYPVCSKTVQDSCVNPGEAKRAKKRR